MVKVEVVVVVVVVVVVLVVVLVGVLLVVVPLGVVVVVVVVVVGGGGPVRAVLPVLVEVVLVFSYSPSLWSTVGLAAAAVAVAVGDRSCHDRNIYYCSFWVFRSDWAIKR